MYIKNCPCGKKPKILRPISKHKTHLKTPTYMLSCSKCYNYVVKEELNDAIKTWNNLIEDGFTSFCISKEIQYRN